MNPLLMFREVESIAWQGSVPVEFVMEGDEVCPLFFANIYIYIYVSFHLFRVSLRVVGLGLLS